MLTFMKVLNTAASGMAAQAERLKVVSENVANADTPGYRRKLVTFEETAGGRPGEVGQVRIGDVSLDASPLDEEYNPTHPLADPISGRVQFSNVNLLTEIADAREAGRSYEANVNMFDQARRLYGSVLELLNSRR
ncbi:MAG: flagellar basal body protein [Pseudomonadota bacterium]